MNRFRVLAWCVAMPFVPLFAITAVVETVVDILIDKANETE